MLLLRRNLGTSPRAGEWVSDPRRHRVGQMISVNVGCPQCPGVIELDARRVSRNGRVNYVWECPLCSFRDFLVLGGWGEAQCSQFDTSDVERAK